MGKQQIRHAAGQKGGRAREKTSRGQNIQGLVGHGKEFRLEAGYEKPSDLRYILEVVPTGLDMGQIWGRGINMLIGMGQEWDQDVLITVYSISL